MKDLSGFYHLYAAEDVTGDGKLDVVNEEGLYLNDGLGNFNLTSQYLYNDFGSTLATDFNGDGRVDLLTLAHAGSLNTYNFALVSLLQVPETQISEIHSPISFGSREIDVWETDLIPIKNEDISTLYLTQLTSNYDS